MTSPEVVWAPRPDHREANGWPLSSPTSPTSPTRGAYDKNWCDKHRAESNYRVGAATGDRFSWGDFKSPPNASIDLATKCRQATTDGNLASMITLYDKLMEMSKLQMRHDCFPIPTAEVRALARRMVLVAKAQGDDAELGKVTEKVKELWPDVNTWVDRQKTRDDARSKSPTRSVKGTSPPTSPSAAVAQKAAAPASTPSAAAKSKASAVAPAPPASAPAADKKAPEKQPPAPAPAPPPPASAPAADKKAPEKQPPAPAPAPPPKTEAAPTAA